MFFALFDLCLCVSVATPRFYLYVCLFLRWEKHVHENQRQGATSFHLQFISVSVETINIVWSRWSTPPLLPY